MTESINYMIGFHCGPTLMGFKVSNLVCIPSECNQAWEELLASYNEQFNKKDLFFFEVCRCKRRRMLLVYRKSQLESYLRDRKNMAFLMGQGYTPQMTLEQLLGRLRDRMEESLNFPHEIGLFLGGRLTPMLSKRNILSIVSNCAVNIATGSCWMAIHFLR